MTQVSVELINGLKLGVEHISADDFDDGVEWMIAIDIFIFRIAILRYKDE